MQEIIINNIKLAEIRDKCLFVLDFTPKIKTNNELNDLSNNLNRIIREYKSLGYAVIYNRYI
jgi:hypothetical protein